MRFSYELHEALPRLAWACEIKKNEPMVKVFHGPWVEVHSEFFYEGAWAGQFDDGDFINNDSFGTGGRLSGDGIIFGLPDHIIERIFVMRLSGRVVVSNSLAFVLCLSDDSLDTNYLRYGIDLGAISGGLKHYHGKLSTRNNQCVELFYYHYICIDKQLRITTLLKQRATDFKDFSSYEMHLQQILKRTFENASDPGRLVRYEPLATVSSGYDSNAVASLAAKVGCRRALTFSRARSAEDIDDSGEVVAERLGLKVKVCDRLGFRLAKDMPELETFGVASEFSSARAELERAVLLVGFMGDSVWERSLPLLSSDLKWALIGGHNLGELRLSCGFVYVPAAFIGAREVARINEISRSEEMKPWTLFNFYDRPIPRRLLEEAGIPRDAFGQTKRAAGVSYQSEGLRATMTEQSYASFSAFLETHWTKVASLQSIISEVQYYLHRLNSALAKRIFRWSDVFWGRGLKMPMVFKSGGRITKGSLLIHWSTAAMQERYRKGLQ